MRIPGREYQNIHLAGKTKGEFEGLTQRTAWGFRSKGAHALGAG
jgi:hypothetical protein